MNENQWEEQPELTEEERCDLILIDRELLGIIIIILGYLLLMFSALKDRREICCTEEELEQFPTTTPAQTATTAFTLIIIGMFILAQVAFNRYNLALENQVRAETESAPISVFPRLNVWLGYLLSMFAYSYKLLGSNQESREETEITIV